MIDVEYKFIYINNIWQNFLAELFIYAYLKNMSLPF